MPEKDKLNHAHKEQIVEWIGDGYSDQDILDRINNEYRRGVLYDEKCWPTSLSRQAIRYYRSNFAERYGELQANSLDVSLGTGLARTGVMVRRASRRVGRMDHLLDQLEAEVEAFLNDGVLKQILYEPVADPDILEPEYTLDGANVKNLPAVRQPRTGKQIEDPRYCRLMDLLSVLPKHYQAHEKYLTLVAKLGGVGTTQKQGDEVYSQEDRRKRIEELLANVKLDERDGVRVSS